jgi:hypothetical protein
MAERSDLYTYWEQSPRIIEVAAPSVEIVLQDLHDTLNSNQEQASAADDSLDNMDDEHLIESAGKEELGGGVKVGITSALLNAQLAFESRTTPVSFGTSTSTGSYTVLTDNTATFISDGVERGAVVINFADRSMAEVLSVDSETQLTHRPLQNGTDLSWDAGDDYQIFNIIQVYVSGGNLVAYDDIGGDIPAIFPTAFTQVVRTASSSATLQELQDIQYSSFNGGVTYDEDNGYSGTHYPIGTPRQPVNNQDDAFVIASERGFTVGYVLSDLNFTIQTAIRDFTFIGSGKGRTNIDIPDSVDLAECTFMDATVMGYLDGECTLKYCSIGQLNYIRGYIESCILEPVTITLAGNEEASFIQCFSGQEGDLLPTIDCGGSGQPLEIRDHNGSLILTNKTGPERMWLNLSSGQIRLTNTVNNGSIVCSGIGSLVDDATGEDILTGTWNGVTIVNELVSNRQMANGVWDALLSAHLVPDSFGYFVQKKLLTLAKFIGLK